MKLGALELSSKVNKWPYSLYIRDPDWLGSRLHFEILELAFLLGAVNSSKLSEFVDINGPVLELVYHFLYIALNF